MDISLIILICVVFNFIFGFSLCLANYFHHKKQLEIQGKLKTLHEFVQSNAAEQAQAFTALAQLVDREFEQQLAALQKMQEYNETVFAKLADEDRKLFEGMIGTQNFLNKMAEGLGFRTRSNLDDL